MKCQKCGAENPGEGSVCSACGAEITSESEDKTATAEILYETLRLYEQLDLDAALAKCKEALSIDPDSPSARSLLGLIYERLAEREKNLGNVELANDYYSAAIRQIERVLEQNPDSAADREKLQELRAKLGIPEPEQGGVRAALDRAVSFIKGIPPAYTAAVVSCAVVFVILGALMGNGASEQGQRKIQPTGVQPNMPLQTYPQQQPQQSAPAWTYQPNAQDEAEQPGYPSQQPSNTYQPLPQIPQPTRTAASPKPVPTDASTPTAASSEPPKVVVPNPPQPEKSPAERAREAMSKKDYAAAARLYEEAISHGENTAENHQQLAIAYYRVGSNAKAEEHFQKAIRLYQDRKARGVDAAGADAGIRVCQDYLNSIRE